ncbi:MAG: hypothetical protein IJ093_00435 [Bacilli bacterium]|nr:hypothetical protein [Bacilli bacterium]
MNENKELKDNTSLIVIIIIGLLIIIGVIAFMMFNNDKTDDSSITDDIKQEADTLSMGDIAGKYYGEYTASDKPDNEKDDSLVEDAKETADDIVDSITDNEEAEENTSYRIELDLDKDGTGRLVNTYESEEVIDGTYTLANRMITFVANVDEENTNIKTTSYMFTVNTDNSLTYNRIGDNFILNKASSNDLKYIK